MTLTRLALPVVAGGLLASPAQAGEMVLNVTIPQIDATPYYRPYLAVWVETVEDKTPLATVAVWYDTRLRDDLGTSFLSNLRNWWRATGKEMTLPADGISGPTRGPGSHDITLDGTSPGLADLDPGQYTLAVEVAREDGARDLVRLPFDWTGAAATASAKGTDELGALHLTVTP
ncbi:DUF2271 domain-containing protein [Pseudooceanicola algae]|uniref:DUF2271 domain-containing protein n=1 Tax=Pseudooceanicola algae TaxID=1537215 RepID=A0A418SJD1_9RHOB|nr:DUF2271 domain-containing protein [Pseudooceanicola algae]QPM91846.1 hypothetical protein PSAL_031080 [Pseudooceanicola algae]